jgi:hypothetical protein
MEMLVPMACQHNALESALGTVIAALSSLLSLFE